jgi:mycofactocin system transcriptional regulator
MPQDAGARPSAGRGRPVATSHADIERVAFDLFREHGFEGTTMEAIAHAAGVGKRTIFRYFPSKNDIPWGQFRRTLDDFRDVLLAVPDYVPVHVAVHRGVLAFNRFPPDAQPTHRERMRLILTTPELQAHSVHQYAEWRAVIADFVAQRLRLAPSDLLPQTVGRVSLALALAAYDAWLGDVDADLLPLLDQTMSGLREYLAG